MLEGELFISSVQVLWEHVHGDPYLRQIPALASLGTCPLQFTSNVTFLVGENGSGKSTLIEAMAVAYGLNPEGGARNYTFSTRDSHSALYEGVFMRRGRLQPWTTFFLRAESFYNVATEAEACSLFTGTSGVKYRNPATGRRAYLHEMSHGEAFLGFIQDSSKENGLYFLDEPEAALSPSRQLTLLYEMDQLARHGSQLIVATHSPILLGLPGAQIVSFDGGELRRVAYEETESYQITELFINNRERILHELLDSRV
ncbi:AAA family ATPase [Collinsella tanakaei]|uniref:AAA family ATPase n=1 Tax=Collinsella tanakaei TaxID=626935 RepID=UPI002F93D3B7